LYEIIIVDSDSPNKRLVFQTVRHIFSTFKKMNIKFYETWHNPTRNPTYRYNIGAKMSTGEVLIFNESDVICVTKDYLKICSENHEVESRLWLSPVLCQVRMGKKGVETFEEIRSQKSIPIDLGMSIRKETFVQTGGFDMSFIGWGGLENHFYDRLCSVGGKHKQDRRLLAFHYDDWRFYGWFSSHPSDCAKPKEIEGTLPKVELRPAEQLSMEKIEKYLEEMNDRRKPNIVDNCGQFEI